LYSEEKSMFTEIKKYKIGVEGNTNDSDSKYSAKYIQDIQSKNKKY